MKYLSPTKTSSSRVFQRGIADLAMEACFLSLLRHENIIGLHYVSEGSLEENYNCAPRQSRSSVPGQPDEIVMDAYGNLKLQKRHMAPQHPPSNSHLFGYFLLLDPLHESLTDRIDKTYVPQVAQHENSNVNANNNKNKMWDRIRHKNGANPRGYDSNDPKVQLAQRLGVVKSVASALTYLHEQCRIIFRDIKPDNIGFYRRYHSRCTCGHDGGLTGHRSRDSSSAECTCYDEITKLFDFGLAKELKPKYRKSHPAYPDQQTFKLTGCTGSRRYMAPEVCFSDPYNVKADVYSFGMLLYQVASMVTPFDGFSMGRHEREVLRGGFRPDVNIPSSSKGKKGQEQQQLMLMDDGGGMTDAERKNELLALKTKKHWPRELPRLMEECWDYDMRYRPEMTEVAGRLERCIDDLVASMGQPKQHGGGVLANVAGHLPKFNGSKDDTVGATTQETFPMSSHHTFSTQGAQHQTPQQQYRQHYQQHAPSPMVTGHANYDDADPRGHLPATNDRHGGGKRHGRRKEDSEMAYEYSNDVGNQEDYHQHHQPRRRNGNEHKNDQEGRRTGGDRRNGDRNDYNMSTAAVYRQKRNNDYEDDDDEMQWR